MNRNKFRFGRAFGVDFLLGGGADDGAGAKSEKSTGVALAILMNLMGRIYVPLRDRKGISRKGEW